MIDVQRKNITMLCDACGEEIANNVIQFDPNHTNAVHEIYLCGECKMKLYKTLHEDLLYEWE